MKENDSKLDIFDRVLRGSAIVLLGNVLGAGAAFLTRTIAARHLGPSDYGLLVTGLSIMGLLAIFLTFGLTKTLGQKIPRSNNKSGIFQTALMISVLTSVLVCLVLVVFSDTVTTFLNMPNFEHIFLLFIATLLACKESEMLMGKCI